MASLRSPLSLLLLFLLFHATPARGAGGELIFEDGYTVSTVLDGDKSTFKFNPQSILHQSPPSDLFILLDSVASTFYTVSLPTTSNETVVERLAGNGEGGYTDGDLVSARFNKPRSFAVDFSGNVYVADQHNHAIRKITKTGVTTIAGGYSQKVSRTVGPARDASFSDNFELTFIPQRCALMISDHGNRLVRQINLKAADCTRHSGSVLGTTSAWLLGLGLSCLLGLIVGFVMRPYIMPYEGFRPLHASWTWTQYQTSLERQIVIFCSGIRNAIVKSSVYSLSRQIIVLSLSQLSLMFKPMTAKPHITHEKPVSLLDIDGVYSTSNSNSSSNSSDGKIVILPEIDDDLKDLLDSVGGQVLPANGNERVEGRESSDVFSDENKKIDGMIAANLLNFEDQVCRASYPESSSECSLGLIKRR